MRGKGVNVGGRFFGVSTRASGKVRANFLNDPATGRDRVVVRVVKQTTGRRGRNSVR
jgi:hypothetical protein